LEAATNRGTILALAGRPKEAAGPAPDHCCIGLTKQKGGAWAACAAALSKNPTVLVASISFNRSEMPGPPSEQAVPATGSVHLRRSHVAVYGYAARLPAVP
jgi:hypothetical protein